MKTKLNSAQVAAAALMAAASVVLLWMAQIVPTMKLSLTALAGVAAALLIAKHGPWAGLLSYAAASLLGFLLAPGTAWLYVVFFGWYPAAKCVIERLNRRVPEWILKLLCFQTAFFLLWFFLREVLDGFFPDWSGTFLILYPVGNIAFILYDLGLSQLLAYYIRVILPKLRK